MSTQHTAAKDLQREYLMKFRRCSSEDTLEKIFERLRDSLTGNELEAMMSASDHRRAELKHKCLWDVSVTYRPCYRSLKVNGSVNCPDLTSQDACYYRREISVRE